MQKSTVSYAHEATRHYRALNRDQIYQTRRQTLFQPYLLDYPPLIRKEIQASLSVPLPQVLPPLDQLTISLYRRAGRAVYLTHVNDRLSLHLLYQSLWLLAQLETHLYSDYQSIVTDFQQNFSVYFQLEPVRELVLIVAGNKALGPSNIILQVVRMDPQQIWILINHIYEKKISLIQLMPYFGLNDELVFRVIYQMTNDVNNQCTLYIMNHQQVLQHLVKSLENQSKIREYALLIVGNLLAEKEEYIEILSKYKILCYIGNALQSKQSKDACWVLSNYTLLETTATEVIRNEAVIHKLIKILINNKPQMIVQVMHVFSHLATLAKTLDVYKLFIEEQFIEFFFEYLKQENKQLIALTLTTLQRLIQVGKQYTCEGEQNIFCHRIKCVPAFEEALRVCSYSDNITLSQIGEMILSELE